jgi:DNA-binding MarR family transcriptional regulator
MSSIPPREERIRGIKDTFNYLMWVSMRHLTQLLQQFGLTFPQYIVLAALAAHQQACTMRDLTSATFEDPPTMTGIVDRLVKTGLAQRTRSETDRRVVLVEATAEGKALYEKANDSIIHDTTEGFRHLSDDDLETVEQLFEYKLRMRIGQYKDVKGTDLDCEIEKLRRFFDDPIQYTKVEKTQPG